MQKLEKNLEQFRNSAEKDRLTSLAENGQKPHTIVVTCADSRVAPEVIFGAQLGELFVIRVAGNVVGPLELASLEYAALELKVADCIVMGHSSCGAVAASVDCFVAKQDAPTAALNELVENIKPAVEAACANTDQSDRPATIAAAIDENAKRMISVIREKSPQVKDLVDSKQLNLRPAVFDMNTSQLRWLA